MKAKNLYNDKSIRKISIISFFVFTIIQSITLIIPIIMKRIIDEDIPSGNTSQLFFNIILMVLIPCIFASCKAYYNYKCIRISRKYANDLAIKIMYNLVDQKLNYFDDKKSMEIVAFANKEAFSYVFFHTTELPKFYGNVVISILLLGIMYFYSPILSLIQLAFIPLAFIPMLYISRRLERKIEMIVDKSANVMQVKSDMIKGIELIKQYRIEEEQIDEIREKSGEVLGIWGRVAGLDAVASVWVNGFIAMIFSGLTFGIGAYLIVSSANFTIGELVTIITYSGSFYAYVDLMILARINKRKQISEHKKLFSYVNMDGEIEYNSDKKSIVITNNIVFDNCDFTYINNLAVLNKVNLNFKIGKWTGIIGHSGGGKSTILDLILKFYETDCDSIHIDDISIKEISSFSIRDQITKVSQDMYIFPGTIRENLLIANKDATEEEISHALEIACLSHKVDKWVSKLDAYIGESGRLLSSGEKRRISLAQAILRGRKILLLDELTGNVDLKTENLIRDNLKKLVDNEGYTIISTSHKKEFLKHCDLIYHIEHGDVIESGNIDDIKLY